MIKGVIFDVDGTLLDSMEIWSDAGARYLQTLNIEAEPNLGNILFSMSLEEGGAYLKKQYALEFSEEEIIHGVLDIIGDFYRNEVRLNENMRDILEEYRAKDIPMVLATTSDKELVTAALERLGILGYFRRIFTASELNTSKREPLIYLAAAEFMKTAPEETAVYEDAEYAINTAKKAGFYTIAVYTEACSENWEHISSMADTTIADVTAKK
ncbi:MAG: HAD family hydrolase [Anaerovoracaceae bacterium]